MTAFAHLIVWVAAAPAAFSHVGSTVPTVDVIVSRMAQARAENRARFRPYLVTRDYKMFGKERRATKSAITAAVSFHPPNVKRYFIQSATGTRFGEKLVRRMLDSEAEITRDYRATDITPQNYDFRFVREEIDDGKRCYVLELLPKRNDKNLLRGSTWVNADSYLLHRREGHPAKSPSWWLPDVRIAFRYGDVDGMWLQTSSEITASVRLFGPQTMVSRDVKYKIGELAAENVSTR